MQSSIDLWKKLGSLNLEQLIKNGDLEFDPEFLKNKIVYQQIKVGEQGEMWGQVNSKDESEGFQKLIYASGEIQEGISINGEFQGYARIIYPDQSVYEGMVKDG